MPEARSEVAAALAGSEIFVAGGFTADGQNSARVDAYSPGTNRWRRVPDLPIAVDHAMAAGYRGRLYVVGGYGPERARLTTAFVLENGSWTRLTPMPEQRAAGGAAVVNGKLYVVGGVASATELSGNDLARQALVLDLRTQRWSRIPGPTRREHLGVTTLGGRIYAIGGRTGGFNSNLDTFEALTPGRRGWRRLARVPGRRGGTAAAGIGRLVVSAGGEAPGGTIRSVFAYDTRTRRWRRLPNLPTPRHGLGVVAAGGRVYVVAGGKQPGLAGVSGANEFLRLP